MNLTSARHGFTLATIALDALLPILHEPAYFTRVGGLRVSPLLYPQIEQAIGEVEAQLTPASTERLQQILGRLMLHYASARDMSDYIKLLSLYPEDLLCAAYQHILRHRTQPTMPGACELVAFMEPELARRKACLHKLTLLLRQEADA